MPSARQNQKLSEDIPGTSTFLWDFANTVAPADVEGLLQEKVVHGVVSQLKNEEWDNNVRYADLGGVLTPNQRVWRSQIPQAAIMIKKAGHDPDVDEGTTQERQLKRWAVKVRRILARVRVPGSTSAYDLYSITVIYSLFLSVLEDLQENPVDGHWAKKLGGRQLSKWQGQTVRPAVPRAHRGGPGGGSKESAKRKSLTRSSQQAMGGTPPAYDESVEPPSKRVKAAPSRTPTAPPLLTTTVSTTMGAVAGTAEMRAAHQAPGADMEEARLGVVRAALTLVQDMRTGDELIFRASDGKEVSLIMP